ncbi:MAG: GYF domain-containing protein [Planctomycetaceae bacterium]|jgi:hypothetical protein|nr:GYF domain-containing protein [Planctomycetaceae bacterium]
MAPQQWYYRKGTARFGPVSSTDIKKMAAEGKLEPTDLLRGVGMTEWVAASRVKGLFPKTESVLPSKPESNDELGLAPLEPIKQEVAPTIRPVSNTSTAKTVSPIPAQKTAQKPQAKPVVGTPSVKPVSPIPAQKTVQKPSAKPVSRPVKPQVPVIPTAPQPFATSNVDASNPFAQFGLDQTVPNAPLSNDPFSIGTPGFGNFDNLVALEKQGQAIYREPAVTVESDPFAAEKTKAKTTSSAISDFGPGGYILFLALPFLFVLLICFPIGVITAWVPLRIIAIAIAVGTSKMVGLIAGSCMLKVKIKNEVLALGYGGLVGLFVTYIFIGASFWTYINVSAYLWKIPQQQSQSFTPPEMDENGRSLVLRPDEPTPFSDEYQQPIPQDTDNLDNKEPENGEENNSESANIDTEKNDSASKIEEQEEEEEYENEEAEWEPNENAAEMKRIQDRIDLMERLFGKGISLLESIFPWVLLKFVWIEVEFNPVGYLFYWLLMCGILVAITAHSTWLANLGSDPTSNSGF